MFGDIFVDDTDKETYRGMVRVICQVNERDFI